MKPEFTRAMKLYTGVSGGYDPVGAFDLFISGQDAHSKAMASIMMASGTGTYKDEVQANILLWEYNVLDSLKDDPISEWIKGRLYQLGVGFLQSDKDAFEHYLKSAESECPLAEHQLGDCYQMGTGVQKSMPEAIKWYRKAAVHGLPQAHVSLAHVYSLGNGVTTSYERAAGHLRTASDYGLPDAQYELGQLYAEGRGVLQSMTEAKKLMQMSAEHGYSPALKSIGKSIDYVSMLRNPSDENRRFLIEVAISDDRNSDSCFALSIMYRNGLGVNSNSTESSKWLSMSSERGSPISLGLEKFAEESYIKRHPGPNKTKRGWFRH